MMEFKDPPTVTGISPIEGVPGTKVTIRGENLGEGPEDIAGLIICGVDCLMSAEWMSRAKIIARSGAGVGKGNIIVVTVLGGRGTSTVQFKGLQEAMGPLKESAVWFDEAIFFNMSFGRKRPLSPSIILQEDPLGLSTEGNEWKEPEINIDDLFPDHRGKLSSVSFSAEKFLLENHMSTSYNDLCAGLKHLQRKVSNQKEGEVAFLKANVGSVLEQVDTLIDLKCRFESDIQEYGRQSTEILESAILNCKNEADKLFEDVLRRKDRADSTRNAINVLKRFQFLFYLPVNTERNIQKGDYDVVINDYARAKSLFGDTQIPLFRRFFDEVEKRIVELRQLLSEQLTKMPTTLEYQKKIIRNLHHLETPGDPAWQCLRSQHEYILHLLVDSRDVYLGREMADHDLGLVKGAAVVNGGTPSSVISRSTPAAKYNKIMMSSVGEWQATAPVRVLFVEELCDLLSSNFPDMWKLSQVYFGRELLPSSADIDHTKQPQCKDMILELVDIYSGIIRGAILPQTLNKQDNYIRQYLVWPESSPVILTPWLPQVLRNVRTCYGTLISLDIPNDALQIIKTLLFDLRVHCVTSLFQQTVDHICSLYLKETWEFEVNDEEGGSSGLPYMCENIIVECAQLVKETALEVGRREHVLLEHAGVCKDIGMLVHNAVVAFAQSLEKLALRDPDEGDLDSTLRLNATLNEVAQPRIEVQLLMTLSNCAHMRNVILPRLTDALVKAGYPKEEMNTAIKNAGESYSELQERLFEAYLEERVDPIIGMIERSMYIGNFEWSKVRRPPKDVGNYAKEIILNIVHVHAEVVSVWPGLLNSLLKRVVEGVAEEMCRLVSCVASFSRFGAVQASADITALKYALNNYISDVSADFFEEALSSISTQLKEDKGIKQEVIEKFSSDTKLLVAALLGSTSSPSFVEVS